MESLVQNKPLMYSILVSGGTVLALTLGIVPELATQFEIIDFPPDVSIRKQTLVQIFAYNLKTAYLILMGFSSGCSCSFWADFSPCLIKICAIILQL